MFNPNKNEALFDAIERRNVPELKRLLDDPEVNVNSVSIYGHTALSLACYCGREEVVRCFLECSRQIDYNYCNPNGWPAIHHVRDPGIMTLLCNDPRIDVNALGNSNESALSTTYSSCVGPLLACERFTSVHVKRDTGFGEQTALEFFKYRKMFKIVKLIEDYIADPAATRERLQQELGYPKYQAAELFATIVLVCDDYYEIKEEE